MSEHAFSSVICRDDTRKVHRPSARTYVSTTKCLKYTKYEASAILYLFHILYTSSNHVKIYI